MHRSAPRLSRILACAAVPLMLVVTGCSSDDGKKDADASASASAKPTVPTVEPAKFTQLPDPCKALAKKTISSLVPKAKVKGGTPGKSSDVQARAGCSWNGLDDNGVKGSQYRWLDVGYTRFASDPSLGSGAARATEDYTKQVAKAQATEDAKKLETTALDGVGEQATAITYDLTKTSEDFEYATVVARTGNVVVTLTYNGAGYAGAKSPSASDILKGAEKAAKEAVAAVATANAADDVDSAGTKVPSKGKSSTAPDTTSSKAPSKSTAKPRT
ncbi:DUF3558 domain-containing protein [Streptomyces finlayi]|uniref:DUF3558 domain-containing protein n=1 Tax=Streptomyces finlayi TaxID=67296 RepID=A0A7G7BN01_9ACTN|nr:DUF3558 domain-containing protein [Streptomyces finlayi]QNE76716.1 DUF3558 domain-containing protein [Streptomyces finlayi]